MRTKKEVIVWISKFMGENPDFEDAASKDYRTTEDTDLVSFFGVYLTKARCEFIGIGNPALDFRRVVVFVWAEVGLA